MTTDDQIIAQAARVQNKTSDESFEQLIRKAGCKPNLVMLGWMRMAFDLGFIIGAESSKP